MPPPLRASALAHWDAGHLDKALADAWSLFDLAPHEIENKALLVDLLSAAPQHASAERTGDLLALIRDPDVNPAAVARAGWQVVMRSLADIKPVALAEEAERNLLIRALLEEAPVTVLFVEQAFTKLRRWLFHENRWQSFPATTTALCAQARRNGGAWLFDAEERARLASEPDTPVAGAYVLPRPAPRPRTAPANVVTSAVAEQYEAWPYPQWTRVTRRAPKQLADVVREIDPDGPETIPAVPQILIAGCGTGREVAYHRVRYPDSRITAIDVSGESLRYAVDCLAQNCLGGAEMMQLDLHDVASLNRRFDLISCIGVLHHLPNPETGWAALAAVLKPGGAMQIMLYSAVARLRVQAMRAQFSDLLQRSIDDDLLREARRRAITRNAKGLVGSTDFFTLAGVHDLLLHRHEDPFDIPRIDRAIDSLGLEFLGFRLPNRHRRARYRTAHPDDPLLRDLAAWEALEKAEPTLFSGMYEFWCRRPVGAPKSKQHGAASP